MYLEHFGLDQYPFTLTPDTEFFLDYGSFKEVLDVVDCALSTGEGFIKVIGEVGTGKTLLCRKLLNSFDEHYVTAYIPNPSINTMALYTVLAKELGFKHGYDIGQSRLLDLIYGRLMSINAGGKQVVLLMDEAQSLPDDSMEALRLLSNLETEKCKLLQVVLFGQPELDARLQQDHMRQLRQRILFGYRLTALPAETLNVYVQHRLYVAGSRGASLFSPNALVLLGRGSRGVPRLINILAHKAMMVAFGRGDRVVDAYHIRRAIADTDDVTSQGRRLSLDTALMGLFSLTPACHYANKY